MIMRKFLWQLAYEGLHMLAYVCIRRPPELGQREHHGLLTLARSSSKKKQAVCVMLPEDGLSYGVFTLPASARLKTPMPVMPLMGREDPVLGCPWAACSMVAW